MSCVIQPNPDISGLGVRISIYIQGLNLFLSCILGWIRGPTLQDAEVTQAFGQHFAMYLTAISILISATIKYSTGELSTYHAIVTLDYLLIAYLATCPLHLYYNTAESKLASEKKASMQMTALGAIYRQIYWFTAFGTFIGVFGFIFWLKLDTRDPACVTETYLWIFGKTYPASTHDLRIFSLVLFMTLAIPLFLVYTEMIINYIIAGEIASLYLKKKYNGYKRGDWEKLTDQIGGGLFLIVRCFIPIMVVATELTVKANYHLFIDNSEAEWGFGQIMAVGIATVPLFDSLRDIRALWRRFEYRTCKNKCREINGGVVVHEQHYEYPSGRSLTVKSSELKEAEECQRELLMVSPRITGEILSNPPLLQLSTYAQGPADLRYDQILYQPFRRFDLRKALTDVAWFELGILSSVETGDGPSSQFYLNVDDEVGSPRVRIEHSRLKVNPTTLYHPKRSAQTNGGGPLLWFSHALTLRFFPFPFAQFQQGPIVRPSDEIWRHLREGDRICVYQCLSIRKWGEKTFRARNSVLNAHLVLYHLS